MANLTWSVNNFASSIRIILLLPLPLTITKHFLPLFFLWPNKFLPKLVKIMAQSIKSCSRLLSKKDLKILDYL